MKWFFKLSMLSILAILFTGCIEMHTVITVKKDGSGLVEENIFVGKEIIKMFTEFAAAFADSTQPPQEFNLFEEEKIKAKTSELGEGVEFVSVKTIKTDEKEGYTAIYKFKDINKVKVNQDPSDEMPMAEPAQDTDPAEKLVHFKFIKGSPNKIIFSLPDEKKKEVKAQEETSQLNSETPAEPDTADFENMVKFMKNMKAKVELKIDGEIVNTNATHVDGNTVTLFDIDFGQLIADKDKLEQFKKFNPDSFEEVKKLVKDIPGIKVELNKEVFIEFE
ncbi:MAG: hypothetical protein HXY50_12170 [Ignavibacteriaceae bacterium]|nr:hypothetical protein [Ignavibacteriaceae bacterium]